MSDSIRRNEHRENDIALCALFALWKVKVQKVQKVQSKFLRKENKYYRYESRSNGSYKAE